MDRICKALRSIPIQVRFEVTVILLFDEFNYSCAQGSDPVQLLQDHIDRPSCANAKIARLPTVGYSILSALIERDRNNLARLLQLRSSPELLRPAGLERAIMGTEAELYHLEAARTVWECEVKWTLDSVGSGE